MKYIDNDMDDLFSKAGDEYPLNTNNHNWDAVQQALAGEQESTVAAAGKNNIRKYYPLLLLLLIPLAYIWIDNGNMHTKMEKGVSPVGKNNQQLHAEKKTAPAITNQEGSSTYTEAVENNKEYKNQNNLKNSSSDAVVKAGIPLQTAAAENRKSKSKGVPENPGKRTNTRDISSSNDVDARTTALNDKQNEPVSNSRPVLTSINTKQIHLSQKDTYATEEFVQKGWSLFPPLGIYTDPAANPWAAIAGGPSYRSLEPPVSSTTAPPKTADHKLPSFYYLVKGGLDVSTIKFQEVRKPGSNISLLLGYHFSKHWSLEAGATWAVKKYYTEGRYFDKTAARITSNIYFLDGGCSMFEFPVGIRYVSNPGKNSFFADGGLVSMVMKKEAYDYKAESQGWVYDGYRKYKNSGNYLFSQLQLGAGYQYKLSRSINFIIEPYLQMPLKKTGIGKMPVTSAGLHLGLLHDIR